MDCGAVDQALDEILHGLGITKKEIFLASVVTADKNCSKQLTLLERVHKKKRKKNY